jgi:hypothetical protein
MTHIALMIICFTIIAVFGIIDNTLIGIFRCKYNFNPKEKE